MGDNLGVAVSMTVIMILAGFVFCSVSAYMAGLGVQLRIGTR